MRSFTATAALLLLSRPCVATSPFDQAREWPTMPQETRQPEPAAVAPDATAAPPPDRADLRARAPSPTAQAVDGYSYLGCFQDGSHHILTVTSLSDSGMTPDLCRNVCALAACPMFGLEWSDQCWCGTALENFAVSAAATTECSNTCYGNSLALCGASGRINVYSATAWTGAPPATTQVITTSGSRGLTTITTTSVGGFQTGAGGGGGGGSSGGGNNNNGGAATFSAGTLAGVAVGAAAAGGLLAAALCYFCYRGRRRPDYYPQQPSGWQAAPPAMGPPMQHQPPPPPPQQWQPSPMTSAAEQAGAIPHVSAGKPGGSYHTPSPAPANNGVGNPPPPAASGHEISHDGRWGHGPPRNDASELSTPYSQGYELPGSGGPYAR